MLITLGLTISESIVRRVGGFFGGGRENGGMSNMMEPRQKENVTPGSR